MPPHALPMALSMAALHARLHVTVVAPRVPGARQAVRMSTAEEEAKSAWLAKQERDTRSTLPRAPEADADNNQAARKRMLAAMGGKDALRSGKMQGFGAEDTEYYGYGEKPQEMPEDSEIDLLTGKPLSQGGDYDPRAQGFGGRTEGWARKPETAPSGPPPMEGTLLSPGQVRLSQPAVPVQAYEYGFATGAQTEEVQGAAAEEPVQTAAAEEEEELLRALRASFGEGGGGLITPP